jgi:hypothetical protein
MILLSLPPWWPLLARRFGQLQNLLQSSFLHPHRRGGPESPRGSLETFLLIVARLVHPIGCWCTIRVDVIFLGQSIFGKNPMCWSFHSSSGYRYNCFSTCVYCILRIAPGGYRKSIFENMAVCPCVPVGNIHTYSNT